MNSTFQMLLLPLQCKMHSAISSRLWSAVRETIIIIITIIIIVWQNICSIHQMWQTVMTIPYCQYGQGHRQGEARRVGLCIYLIYSFIHLSPWRTTLPPRVFMHTLCVRPYWRLTSKQHGAIPLWVTYQNPPAPGLGRHAVPHQAFFLFSGSVIYQAVIFLSHGNAQRYCVCVDVSNNSLFVFVGLK